mgnify:CR=1 FL=1
MFEFFKHLKNQILGIIFVRPTLEERVECLERVVLAMHFRVETLYQVVVQQLDNSSSHDKPEKIKGIMLFGNNQGDDDNRMN